MTETSNWLMLMAEKFLQLKTNSWCVWYIYVWVFYIYM